MYRVLYGDELLHDPRTDSALLGDLQMEQNQNECGYCEFTIYPDHPLHGALKERDMENKVKVYDDEALLFQGFIYELGKDFQTSGAVKCKGDLALLECSRVRPYSTLEGVYETTAPNTADGYFEWLIEQHNEQVEQEKRFAIGMNEGSLLDKNNYIYRESKQLPTTAEELESKILEELGGYIRVRYPGGVRTIDLMAECYDANTQIFDFGVNLMDYQETTDALEMYTALVLQGATPEGDSSENALPLTIESLEDGIYAKDTGFSKLGDLVYSHSGVERYGWIVGTYENKDITTAEALLDAGVIALKAQVSPVTTIEVKAVDLSIINKDYQPVQVGEYVRVRSKVHDFDSYMLCTSIEPNLNNPEDSLYTLGMTFDSLTGIQNKRINALNATMTRNYERVEAVSVESKAAAITAGQAKEAASEAQTAAGNAQEVAGNASQAAADAADKAKEAQNKANEASDAAEDAKAAANEAQDAANDAAKTATNFIAYDESGGLQIGNKTSGSWSGFRTQITATAFNVLDSAGTVLASYGAKLIELGKNATDAVIKLCGGKGTIQAETADDGESYLTLHSDYVRMRADNTASLYSSWTNSSNMASKSALHLTHDQLNVFSEDSQNLVDGVGTWRSSSFLVCPYQIGGLADEISLMSRYGTSLHTVSGDISLFAEGGSVSINGRAYGVNRVLASTTSFMHSGQYISFSEPISSQPNGAVFVWSLYSGGAAANTDFIYCFVPKSHVINHNGSGVLMGSTSAWQHMAKYIYVRDTDCNGNDINDDTQITVDGVTIRNSAYVLRYVIGV